MRYSLFILAYFLVTSGFAQITITESDLPQPNARYERARGANLFIDVSATGANHIWDYSQLTANNTDTAHYVTVSQTPVLYQFAFNNPFSPTYRATDALATDDLVLGPIRMTNSYTYYKSGTNERNEVGRGMSFNGIPIPITYDDVKTLLPIPLQYNDLLSDSFAYQFEVPNLLTIGQKGNAVVEVDGWGQLILPNDTLEVLRVKSSVTQEDTVFLDTLGFGFNLPSAITIYEWYAKGMGAPVLQITQNGLGITTQLQFLNSPPITSITSIENSTIKLFPNPTVNYLQFEGVSEPYTYMITAVNGQVLVEGTGKNTLQISVAHLPSGHYIFHWNTPNTQESCLFIKN